MSRPQVSLQEAFKAAKSSCRNSSLSTNLKVGRAVLCAPMAATTLSCIAQNGAHGVTRPTSAKPVHGPKCASNLGGRSYPMNASNLPPGFGVR